MPLILALAAFTSIRAKYLLPIPAQAAFVGTLAGAWLASRSARPLEVWGWLLIALSMAAGLFMGLYAFDGPFPSPTFLGAYNDFPRRLSRLGHAYCIVLGLLSIFVARSLDKSSTDAWSRRLGVPLLVAASIVTVALIALVGTLNLPVNLLSPGPGAVSIATVLCIAPLGKNPRPSPAGAEDADPARQAPGEGSIR
jgi:4-amino-4-deoxy-L-arabinose transferase-like glycosyltransferase